MTDQLGHDSLPTKIYKLFIKLSSQILFQVFHFNSCQVHPRLWEYLLFGGGFFVFVLVPYIVPWGSSIQLYFRFILYKCVIRMVWGISPPFPAVLAQVLDPREGLSQLFLRRGETIFGSPQVPKGRLWLESRPRIFTHFVILSLCLHVVRSVIIILFFFCLSL